MVLPPQGPPAIVVTGLTRRLRSRIVVIMNIRLWIIVWLCLLSHMATLWSADQSLAEKRRSYLLTGMRAEREKLLSGHVIMSGEHWKTTQKLGNIRVSVKFELAFDKEARLYRCSQRDFAQYVLTGLTPVQKTTLLASRSSLPHGTTPEGIDWCTEEQGGTVVHTPEYDLHLAVGTNRVTRLAPGIVRKTQVYEWDLDVLGLIDWVAFRREYHLNDLLIAYEKRLKCHSVDLDQAGLACLKLRSDWNPNADTVEYEIWIDQKEGMTPISISRKDMNNSMRESSRSEVSWREINGVKVPVAFRIIDAIDPNNPEGYDLTLEWIHVNEPLDPKLFTPAGITESNSALVADLRLGQVVVERVHPLPLPVATPKPVAPQPSSRLGWIVLGHLVVGGGVSWWYSRRKSRSQSAGST